MSGIDIHCGSFTGNPASGTAIEGVLAALTHFAEGWARAAIERLEAELVMAANFVMISPADAASLLPAVRRYRLALEQEVGGGATLEDLRRYDEDIVGLDPTEARLGKGKGWQLYCLRDLEQAFLVAGAEARNVILRW